MHSERIYDTSKDRPAHEVFTPDRRQSKTFILSTNVDQNSLKQFSIDIFRPTDDKWQSKTLFPAIFNPRPSIKSGFDFRLSGVVLVLIITSRTESVEAFAANMHKVWM